MYPCVSVGKERTQQFGGSGGTPEKPALGPLTFLLYGNYPTVQSELSHFQVMVRVWQKTKKVPDWAAEWDVQLNKGKGHSLTSDRGRLAVVR